VLPTKLGKGNPAAKSVLSASLLSMPSHRGLNLQSRILVVFLLFVVASLLGDLNANLIYGLGKSAIREVSSG
jgi:hypothetical protein